MSRSDVHAVGQKAADDDTSGGGESMLGVAPDGLEVSTCRMTTHEASRVKKAVDSNVKAIENRIRFFQREEEKIWRDLEEVRRQAATIEDGRSRTLEKKIADRTIQQERENTLRQNQAKVAVTKSMGIENRKRNQLDKMREKQIMGQEQRRVSQDILRQKRMQEAQVRLQNSERAVAIQRANLEARLKVNQEKAERLEKLREQQEADRQAAEMDVQEAGSKLPQLEAEEMVCLQRLQNSRIVTQSVLEELETSLGSRSSVTSLLRAKQRGQEHLDAPLVEENDQQMSLPASPDKLTVQDFAASCPPPAMAWPDR